MNILALDLSLTCIGVASHRGSETIETHPNVRGVKRLQVLRDVILNRALAADVVILEGYAYGRPNQAHQLGELGGCIRLAFYDNGIEYVDIAPTLLKRYACGKGNASKDQVLSEAVRRLGYPGHSNDEADALWLREMALDQYGVTVPRVPLTHRKALDSVKWPTVATVVDTTLELEL